MKEKPKKSGPRGLYFPTKTFPYKFYEEALCCGRIKRFKKREIVIWKGLAFPLARVIWILTHPKERIRPEDEVHHLDGDRNNNHWENLIRVTPQQHNMLHWEPKSKNISWQKRLKMYAKEQ
jgi:hypothetical protein